MFFSCHHCLPPPSEMEPERRYTAVTLCSAGVSPTMVLPRKENRVPLFDKKSGTNWHAITISITIGGLTFPPLGLGGRCETSVFYLSFLRACLWSYKTIGININIMTGQYIQSAASSYLCRLSSSMQYVQGLFPNSSASSINISTMSYFVCCSPSQSIL